MARITHESLLGAIRDLKIVLLGVEETEDTGLYGDVKDMMKLLREINGTVKSDHAWSCAMRWAIYIIILALVGIVTTGAIGVW